jgi:hypothetical protein
MDPGEYEERREVNRMGKRDRGNAMLVIAFSKKKRSEQDV